MYNEKQYRYGKRSHKNLILIIFIATKYITAFIVYPQLIKMIDKSSLDWIKITFEFSFARRPGEW